MDQDSSFISHTSCEACGSSDGNAIYSNSTTYCFACQKSGKYDLQEEASMEFEVITDYIPATEIRGLQERKITKPVMAHYGCTVKTDPKTGEFLEHWYPYSKNGEVVGHKIRGVADKRFSSKGDLKQTELFGQKEFQGGGKKLVITEGELDAMALAQAFQDKYNRIFPVVSVPSGAQSAAKAILTNREWVRSFDEVILMFDMDEPGQAALSEAAKVVGADKVKIAKLKAKDPSAELIEFGSDALVNTIWNAAPWQPAGVINAKDAWEDYMADKDAIYQPFPGFLTTLNERIHGLRLGSITMLTSGTGCGKTTFVKEVCYDILQNTNDMIGLVSLEESTAETIRGFISLDLNKRVGLPNVVTTEEEEKAAFERTLGTGRTIILDHNGSCEDASLVEKLEFMALSGCKYLVLDHISIAVSEAADGNTNGAIDSLMSTLLKLCKRHDIHIMVISHLRKVGGGSLAFEAGGDIQMDDLKGSGSLKQISAQVISLSRNLSAEDERDRNTVKVSVLKDRFTGATGPAGCFRYDQKTGRLERAEAVDSNGFHNGG